MCFHVSVFIVDIDSGSFGEVTFNISDPHFSIALNPDKKSAQIRVAQ